MKKIIAIALVLACSVALFACGGSDTAENIDKMFKSVAPTKVVTEITENVGELVLVSTSTLTSGTVDGKAAATYESLNMRLRTVSEGSGDVEVLPWVEVYELLEYHDGKGLRTTNDKNGTPGAWDEGGYNFAPTAGKSPIVLTKETMQDVEEDEAAKTIKFTILAADTATVLSGIIEEALESDVAVTITHDGSAITGITLTYTVLAEEKDHPDIETTIKILYSYDAEQIKFK